MFPHGIRALHFLRVTAWLPLCIALALGGCSDSAPPQPEAGDGSGHSEGFVDPGAPSFVLESIASPVPGEAPVRIDLIGRNLSVDPQTEQVQLEVAVRNADRRTLRVPIEIVVADFGPRWVVPTNADWTTCPDTTGPPPPTDACEYGFDYAALVGDDGALTPGEISGYRTWALRVPGLVAFSFRARARFDLQPDDPPEPPRIAGLFFHDLNENARFDPGEGPFPGGWVEVTGPGLDGVQVRVGSDGRYTVLVRNPGLYTLIGYPPPVFGIEPIHFTTPNPLEVVLPPGPDGAPQSYLGAHFGLARGGMPPGDHPPVILVDQLPDSLPQDPYNLLRIALRGDHLVLDVGYSGCQPEHPLRLFMVGGFMESWPVQARLVLVHDDLGEHCDAYFERNLIFDLRPIRRAYIEAYGGPGTVILRFVDWLGETHTLEYGP